MVKDQQGAGEQMICSDTRTLRKLIFREAPSGGGGGGGGCAALIYDVQRKRRTDDARA